MKKNVLLVQALDQNQNHHPYHAGLEFALQAAVGVEVSQPWLDPPPPKNAFPTFIFDASRQIVTPADSSKKIMLFHPLSNGCGFDLNNKASDVLEMAAELWNCFSTDPIHNSLLFNQAGATDIKQCSFP